MNRSKSPWEPRCWWCHCDLPERGYPLGLEVGSQFPVAVCGKDCGERPVGAEVGVYRPNWWKEER